jgi:hypothetical protein
MSVMSTQLLHDEFLETIRGLSEDFTDDNLFVEVDLRRRWHHWASEWPNDAAKFVLNGIDLYDEAVLDFGRQMACYRALAMPASAIFVQWDMAAIRSHVMDVGNISNIPPDVTGIFVRVLSQDEQCLKISMTRVSKSSGLRGADVPIAIDLFGAEAERLLNLPRQKDIIDADSIVRTYLEELLAFLAVLAIKDVKRVQHAPSPRLRAKREKKNLPPLPDYVVLYVSSAAIARAGQEIGVDRSSPRPHFRRGHIRTLYRGSDQQRLVAVAPSWVRAEPGQARVPNYIVKPT